MIEITDIVGLTTGQILKADPILIQDYELEQHITDLAEAIKGAVSDRTELLRIVADDALTFLHSSMIGYITFTYHAYDPEDNLA